MKLFIDRDFFDNPKPPRLFLCTTGKKIIQELPSYDESLDGKWGSYSEASFSIDRQYVDVLTGEVKVHPTFDKAEGLRKVYMENIGYFVIQDPDTTYGEKDSKTLSCFSSEYETANKYLENFRVNTGEIDSKEVIALEKIHGYNYTIDKDNLYKKASGSFDPYENYYIQNYTDNKSYVYEQVEVKNAAEYGGYDGTTVEKTLYVKNYPNVRFYWPTNPELSFLNIVFDKIPGWKIGNVNATLWRKERKFDEDRIAVYDLLMNETQETFNCVVEWDTITNEVNFYEEAEDGITEDNTVQTRWETDVFISRDNLANEIGINYSTDDIKTKLKVSGADDLDIREVNLGQNYIMNLDYYHTLDWMEQDLFEAYEQYLITTQEAKTGLKADGTKSDKFSMSYTEAMQKWVGAYNKWNDLMNAVPAEGNVVLVGDPFEKLYCVYGPMDTAYLPQTVTDSDLDKLVVENLYTLKDHSVAIDKQTLKDRAVFSVQGYHFSYVQANDNFKCLEHMSTYNERALVGPADEPKKGKLSLYHIIDDTEASEPDNILLRLRNANSDTATIRIYNKGTKTNPEYIIQSLVISATNGAKEKEKEFTISQWVRGELTAKLMGLEGYTVQYIGVMGAYFVLAKDETQEATLEEYGVNLLKEKHDTYVTIFQTQTEAMLSQEKYQCIVQPEQPEGDYDVGTRWLDTNSPNAVLKSYNGQDWVQIQAEISDVEQANYENYQRYIDNYNKMVAVQSVLVKKEKLATYMRDGYEISNRTIPFNLYVAGDDGVLRYKGETLESDMYRAAESHFAGHTISPQSMDYKLPAYYFTTSYDPNNTFAIYLKGTVPYVAYADSQGVYDTIKDWIARKTDFESFFTEDQWIRLSPFIREDEFSDSNFLLTSYESEEERLKISNELFDAANKEINKICQPKLEFSMEMANIFALPEFEPLINQFQLGNFVRVYIRDGYVKRARLLEAHLSFNDLSDFNCSFGNLVTTKSEIDKHADLLAQAVSAGKQVATSAGDWQRAVDKSNSLEEEIANGLQNSAIQVGRASGQSITWDEHGFKCRKLVDGTTDQYLDEQIAIINNKIVFTNDGWKTSKAALGEFEVDTNGDGVNEKMYGLLADAVVSGYVKGSVIEGGSLKIGGTGGTFIVHEDGSVQILAADAKTPIYATQSDVDLINNARQYRIELSYDRSTIFGGPNQECTLTCQVYEWDADITSKLPSGTQFSWLRNGTVYKTTTVPTLTVKNEDIDRNAIFSCSITFDETQIK